MDNDSGGIFGAVLILVIAAAIIYIGILLASVIAIVAGSGGVLWGGGTAVVNYGRSVKENMIDSNRKAA